MCQSVSDAQRASVFSRIACPSSSRASLVHDRSLEDNRQKQTKRDKEQPSRRNEAMCLAHRKQLASKKNNRSDTFLLLHLYLFLPCSRLPTLPTCFPPALPAPPSPLLSCPISHSIHTAYTRPPSQTQRSEPPHDNKKPRSRPPTIPRCRTLTPFSPTVSICLHHLHHHPSRACLAVVLSRPHREKTSRCRATALFTSHVTPQSRTEQNIAYIVTSPSYHPSSRASGP